MAGYLDVSPLGLAVERILFTIAAVAYLVSAAGYLVAFWGQQKKFGPLASWLLRVSFFLHTAFLVARTVNAGRIPLVGHFEFGNVFIWACVLFYLWVEWRLSGKDYSVGAFLTPLVVLYLGYLTVIPVLVESINISRAHKPLQPVLQSRWLQIHVSASVLGYAGFTLAFAVALMWLFQSWLKGKALARNFPAPQVLEEYMYRASGIGFLFQSIMLVTGAIWADTSWGRYWGWDPKEVWALITWFVFAVYLHARLTRGWKGMLTVMLVIAGWIAMVFTWIGVAWLLSGIHSFG